MTHKEKALEFAQEGYSIQVTGRHVQVTDSMKEYAIEKISKIDRLSNRIIDVAVTMDIQKLEHRIEVVMKVGNLKINCQATSPDMYASVDKVIDKLMEQLRRYKTRIHDYHNKTRSEEQVMVSIVRANQSKAVVDEVNDDIEAESRRRLEESCRPHEIVEKKTKPLKTLTYDEAILKMELSQDAFLLFRHEEDQKLKLIYRRNDGNYGIAEPKA